MPRDRLGTSAREVTRLVLGGNVFGWTAGESTSHDIRNAFIARGNAVHLADSYPPGLRDR